MDISTEIAIVASGMTLVFAMALVFLPPSHGLAMPVKVLAAMIVISGFAWLVAAVLVGRRLNVFFMEFLPSTVLMKSAMSSFKKGSNFAMPKLIGGMVAGSVLNNLAIEAAMQLLGEPMCWIIYAATNPFLPVAIFGILPLIHALASVGVVLSYGNVLEAGGDGSEFVEADRIEWFYALPKKERNKILDNRGHLSDSDDDSDSDSDEEEESDESRSLVK